MKFEFLHPADQIVLMMSRIYQGGMTTTSGGNLSILDDNGDIWITPSAVDKGTLTRGDICCVKKDGTIIGAHKPSSEFPFHDAVYKMRPDIHAVLHAHPPALVAFSVVRAIPDVNLVPNARKICGTVGMAVYATPGSDELGNNIGDKFRSGHNIVMMENHGVCIGADNLFEAFKRFETLEACAMLEINAKKLEQPKSLQDAEMNLTEQSDHLRMDEFVPNSHSSKECAARRDMINLIHRSYRQHLFGSTQGTYSVRLSDDSFLITPYGIDRAYMNESDLVLIKRGMKEQGKIPSRSVKLHQYIYEKNKEINSVLGANPPHAMSFAVTNAVFDPRTIPESYILLRDVPKVPFSAIYLKPEAIAEMFTERTPVLMCENNQILATGNSLLNAFDRLEVMEATAHTILLSKELGEIVHISDDEIADINKVFKLN